MFNKDLVVLRNLEPKIVEKDVYRYLQYNSGKTKLTGDIVEKISDNLNYTKSLLQVSAIGCIKEIEDNTGEVLKISGGYEFSSKFMCEWLKGCSHILLMGSTAGRDVMAEVNRLKDDNLFDAIIVNAIASSAADEGLQYVEQYFARLVLRHKMGITSKRWSVGYADLDIKYQHTFYEILKMDGIDVDILESGMLVPEKSVTGFCGIH
jgi:hypothetical protein